jgi:predicted transcriptional regulator
MKENNIKPTDSELQILQVLWDKGPSSVREVNEILNEIKETGYTTTLKLMQIMTEKDLVSRDTTQRTHIYTAAVAREATQSSLLQSFLKSTFQGSAKALVLQALGSNTASEQELQEIKDLIDKLQNQ